MSRMERLASPAEIEPVATATDQSCGLPALARIAAGTLIAAAFLLALTLGAAHGRG